MRTCGTCKYWIPETTGLIAQAKAKHPWPHCSLNGETKTEDSKPCLAWTGGRGGEISGKDTMDNLVTACRNCNQGKKDMVLG